jgi:ABC-type transport system involved in multi-copper enzyme maturation permease subunit
MNRGLLAKSIREATLVTVMLSAALMLIEGILSFVLPTVMQDFSATLLQLPFFRTIIQALLGADVGDQLVPQTFVAIAWVHPTVLALVWTQAIVFCTRVPAGEIDRGTIDMLLGLPVSRWQVYVAETVVFLGSGLVMLLAALIGYRLGIMSVAPDQRPSFGTVLVIVVNLYCMFAAVGGLAFMVSAIGYRRGRAIAVVFGILIFSFMLNFLVQFWPPARGLAFLGVLNYYQPLPTVRTGDWPLGDMIALLSFGAVFWTAGGLWFARRDICTV